MFSFFPFLDSESTTSYPASAGLIITQGFVVGTQVILKVINVSLINDPQPFTIKQRMEALLHEKCSGHPHILNILDIFCSPSFTAIVLPAWGQDLSNCPLPSHCVLNACWQIASGITHMHALRILHGDLHTGNVLILAGSSPDRHLAPDSGHDSFWLQITDFGLAVVCDPFTDSIVLRYPVFFRPPELLLSMYICELGGESDEEDAADKDADACMDCKHLQVWETTWNYRMSHIYKIAHAHSHIYIYIYIYIYLIQIVKVKHIRTHATITIVFCRTSRTCYVRVLFYWRGACEWHAFLILHNIVDCNLCRSPQLVIGCYMSVLLCLVCVLYCQVVWLVLQHICIQFITTMCTQITNVLTPITE